jgi:hypothetical protein
MTRSNAATKTKTAAKSKTLKVREAAKSVLKNCAKMLDRIDRGSINIHTVTLFDSGELQQLIWCFGLVQYNSDAFWLDLLSSKVLRLSADKVGDAVDAALISKVAWAVGARLRLSPCASTERAHSRDAEVGSAQLRRALSTDFGQFRASVVGGVLAAAAIRCATRSRSLQSLKRRRRCL